MKISELPFEVKVLALLRQKEIVSKYYRDKKTDDLDLAFDWSETEEGFNYWEKYYLQEDSEIIESKEPKHYDNSKGSLYKFCDDHELNPYEFDIIKRVMRCRKKGLFLEDLEKTKFLIDLYIKEEIEKYI
jgi:hypothetical protein